VSTPTPAPQPPGPQRGGPSDPGTHLAGGATSTGLDPKVAGLLAYLGIIGIVLFFLEKDHREVRFHAAQNTVLCIALFAVYVGLSVVAFAVPFLWLLNVPLWFAAFGLWVYLVIQGYNLNHVALPVIGDIAERWASL
jgi:uncharacterized membrane protein